MEHFTRRSIVDSFGYNNNFSTNDTEASGLIWELFLENSAQSRGDTIVTAAFNVAAAFCIILGVMADSYKGWKKQRGLEEYASYNFFAHIHPAETYPLVISTAIVMQGFIFIIVQSMGLNALYINNCRAISQVIWPAVWLFADVLLVFGVEVAYRALKTRKFGPRGRWTMPICWSIVVLLLILTWIPSKVRERKKDRCLASLIRFAGPWADFGVAINAFIILAYLVIGGIITYQLYKNVKIDREERIAASRMVYYLGVGVFLMSFVLPFWISTVAGDFEAMTTARTATIALNVSGMIIGLLQLILRANAEKMAIRPPQADWGRRREWRIFGSADLTHYIEDPITLDDRSLSKRVTVGFEKRPLPGLRTPQRPLNPTTYREPLRSNPAILNYTQPPPLPESSSSQPKSYSLFPGNETTTRASSYYGNDIDMQDLAPPRPLFARGHKRDDSNSTVASTATVQIGLRLSHAALAAVGGGGPFSGNIVTRPPMPAQFSSDESLHLPIQQRTTPEDAENPFEDPRPNLTQLESPYSNNNDPTYEQDSRDTVPQVTDLPPQPSPTYPKARSPPPRRIGLPTSPSPSPFPQNPLPPRRVVIRASNSQTTGPRTPGEEEITDMALNRPSMDIRSPGPEKKNWPLREPSLVLLPSTTYSPPERKAWI